jgi:hypothetical protein
LPLPLARSAASSARSSAFPTAPSALLVLIAHLQELLLGVRRQLDAGGDRVGGGVAQIARIGALPGCALGQLGERLARRAGGFLIDRGHLLLGDQLDLARGILGRFEAVEDLEWGLAAHHDVHPSIVEALDHVVDAGGAADRARTLVVTQHDPERFTLLEGGSDHALVALLEDVQRNLLAWQQDEGQLEDRKLEARHSRRF